MKIYDFDFSKKADNPCKCKCKCGSLADHEKCHGESCDTVNKCCEEKEDKAIKAYDNMFRFWDQIEYNKNKCLEEAKETLKDFECGNDLDAKSMAYIVGVPVIDYDNFFEDNCDAQVKFHLISAARSIRDTIELGIKGFVEDIVSLAKRTYTPNEDDLTDTDEPLSAVCESGSVIEEEDDDEEIEIDEESLKNVIGVIGKIFESFKK